MTPAKKRLVQAIPHFYLAAEEAKKAVSDAKIGLGIIARRTDGSGYLAKSFECEEFFSDLADVLDVCLRCGEPKHEGDCDLEMLRLIQTTLRK